MQANNANAYENSCKSIYVFTNLQEGGENMNKKQTSKTVATKASRILRNGRYGSKAKSVAGSALAQTKTGKKK